MALLQVTPMLDTREMSDTIDFYVGRLGFQCDVYNEQAGWALLFRDDVELMLSLPNEHVPFDKPLLTGSIYFRVDNVDELWAEFEGKVEVCYSVEDFDYGMREFAIYDNNGYTLQFGQPVVLPEQSSREDTSPAAW